MQTIFVDISECHQYYNLASILSEGLHNSAFLVSGGDDHGYYSCIGPINMHEECTEMPVMLQQPLLRGMLVCALGKTNNCLLISLY